jgi:hypothetical protein
VLGRELGVHADNLAKFLHEYTRGPHAARLRAGESVPAYLRPFRLRPGDVVLVDEAGMAATHDLDQLAAIASVRGALVRLLGDHRQLSAVESGGALRLLATEAGAAELTTLYRFRDPAEAAATLQLRTGDAAGLDFYFSRGRVRSGSLQAMAEAAYAGWKTDMLAGKTTLMAAASGNEVAALSAQARTERVAAGQVEPGGIELRDGTLAGRGDWIITRQNQRRLGVRGGRDWVKNGDAWQVTGRGRDGSLQARHLGHGGQVTLPAAYVQAHVQLLYATTAHRAQGATVDTAHPLITADMTRESFYVIASRARERTSLYAATHDLLPLDEDKRLDLSRTDPRSYAARELLENVLAREGAELSATESIRTTQERAGSLATLAPRYCHAASLAARSRYAKAAIQALGGEAGRGLTADPAWGVVCAALHTAEALGWQPARLLAQVVPARELRTAGSIGAVIAWRIEACTAGRAAPPRLDQPTITDVRRYAALMNTIPALQPPDPDAEEPGPLVPPWQTGHARRAGPDVSRQDLARCTAMVAAAWSVREDDLVRHRSWPHLAAAVISAGQAGHNLPRLLAQARYGAGGSGDGIGQLARTTRRLLRARGIGRSSAPLPAPLRYVETVTAVLGPGASERARGEPAWLAVEAALRRAGQAGHEPAAVLRAAIGQEELDAVPCLSEALAWRVGRYLAGRPGPTVGLESGGRAVEIARTRHTLAWTLKAAENDGANPADILAAAANAPEAATVLHLVTEAADRQHEQARSVTGLPPWIGWQNPAQGCDAELALYARDAAGLVAARVRDLALDVAQRRPAWARGLGDPPADPAAYAGWLRHAGVIVAYRDQYEVASDDPRQVLGPYAEPGHAGHSAYWLAAESVLAARRLAGLEPAERGDPADTRARSQLATDIYLGLPGEERAAIQAAMISRLDKAWFGARNETDDHAVTRRTYAPYLAAVLAERGHLRDTTLSTTGAGEGVPDAVHLDRVPCPLEADLRPRRQARSSAQRRAAPALQPTKPRRHASPAVTEADPQLMPVQAPRPAPGNGISPVSR